MFSEIVRTAGMVAVIVLAVEGLVFALGLAVILFYITRWLRRFIPQVRATLERARDVELHLLDSVEHGMALACAPVAWLARVAERPRKAFLGVAAAPGRRR